MGFLDDIWGQISGQQQAPPPPSPAGNANAYGGIPGSADDSAAARSGGATNTMADIAKRDAAATGSAADDPYERQARAQAAYYEAQAAKLQADVANAETPAQKRAAEEALARLQDDLARARQRDENNAALARLQAQLQAQSEQAGLDRAQRADENATKTATDLLGLGQRRDEANLSAQVSLRGQEMDRLKAQDDWVLGMLRQQVEEGRLGLEKATNLFNAYITRARLPSEILKNVGDAVSPLLPYMTGHKAGESPPGFEKGGPMDALVTRAGASYDPAQYAVNPVGVNLFDLAKKAGADFSQTKVPDPGSVIGSVKVPSTDPGSMRSALGQAPPSPSLLGNLPLPPSLQMPPAVEAQIRKQLGMGPSGQGG